MAETASTEPDDRSMPPVMITWVTPMAMSPTTDTWRIITSRRCSFSRKLCPRTAQPSASKNSAMPTSTSTMPSSLGRRRRPALRSAAAIELVSGSVMVPCPVLAGARVRPLVVVRRGRPIRAPTAISASIPRPLREGLPPRNETFLQMGTLRRRRAA